MTILAGLLAYLSFLTPYLFWLSFFTIIPIIYRLCFTPYSRTAFLYGWSFGIVHMGLFHLWIFQLTPWSTWIGASLLWISWSIYQGVFYGISCYLFHKIRLTWPIAWTFPACWVLGEWLRGLGPLGNTAGSIGYTQVYNPLFLPIATYVGLYGLSFLCIWINIQLYFIYAHPLKRWPIYTTKLIFMSVFCIGLSVYHVNQPLPTKTLDMSILQGNHAQAFKLNPRNWPSIKDTYFEMLLDSPQSNIVIMPETLVPNPLLNDNAFSMALQKQSQKNNQHIIVGSPIKGQETFYNGILTFSPNSQHIQAFYKETLMPFGEYIPFREIFEKINWVSQLIAFEDYSRKENTKLIQINDYQMGTGICLESIYPNYYRNQVLKGADFLSVLVNNAWFFESAAAKQHLEMSRMRAVESNRYMVQSGNTGISAIINHIGKVETKTRLNESKILNGTIRVGFKKSIYTTFGNIIIWISGILVLWGFIQSFSHDPNIRSNTFFK